MNRNTLLETLATYVTPVAPAVAYGWHTYSFSLDFGIPAWGAFVAALCAAIALELVGIYAGKSTLNAWRQKKRSYTIISGFALLTYVFIGMWELQGTPFMWLTLIAFLGYVINGVNEVLDKDESLHIQALENKQADKAENRKSRETIKLAEIEASKQVELARISTEPARSQHRADTSQHELAPKPAIICSCGRDFPTVQAKNAHQRFCKHVKASNGHLNGVTP